MKEYPSILGPSQAPNLPCIAFYKHDGSNLRFEWQRKKGWCKFGTRKRLFDETDPDFAEAISIFARKYASDIEKIIGSDKQFRGADAVTCFCEFFGPHSFAGTHDALKLGVADNDPKDLKLFDVSIHKKGLMTARAFLDTFGRLDIPAIIYEGNLNAQFIQDVKNGKYPVWEGVVCKGCEGKPPHGIWMRKVKTRKYLEALKTRFAADWEQYAE